MPDLNQRGESFKDAIADKHAAADERVDTYRERFSARVLELMNSVGGRIESIFERAGAPALSIVEAAAVINPSRDVDMAAITAAAQRQAYVEIVVRDVIKSASKHTDDVESKRSKMSKGELAVAAVEGVTKEQFNAAKERRSNGASTATQTDNARR